MNPCAEPRKFEMADSLRRGVRGCHGIGPVTARLTQREITGILEKMAESVVALVCGVLTRRSTAKA